MKNDPEITAKQKSVLSGWSVLFLHKKRFKNTFYNFTSPCKTSELDNYTSPLKRVESYRYFNKVISINKSSGCVKVMTN